MGRSIRLTESGKIFLNRALQAVCELEKGSNEIDALKGLLRGNICIATLPLYGSRLIPDWMKKYNKLHPDVHVTVRALPSEDIEICLLAGTIDLGLSFLPVQSTDISSKNLFNDEIMLVASASHPISAKENLKASDLKDLKMAIPSERISASRKMVPYFEVLGISPKVSMSFDDGHALLELVRQSDFVTLLPKQTVENRKGFCLHCLPSPGIQIELGAVWTHMSPATKAFLDMMTELY